GHASRPRACLDAVRQGRELPLQSGWWGTQYLRRSSNGVTAFKFDGHLSDSAFSAGRVTPLLDGLRGRFHEDGPPAVHCDVLDRAIRPNDYFEVDGPADAH